MMMNAKGHIQPTPDTPPTIRRLWAGLAFAKLAKDYNLVGDMTDRIRRLTVRHAQGEDIDEAG